MYKCVRYRVHACTRTRVSAFCNTVARCQLNRPSWIPKTHRDFHIVTLRLVCWDINHFAPVARPCSSTRGSDGPVCQPRLPSRCTPSTSRRRSGSYLFDQLAAAHRSRAAAEGQERDLVPGIPGPQRRPEGDQGRCAGCLRRARARLSPSVTVDLVCLVGAGHPRCSRPARSRRARLVPSLAA